MLVLIFIIGIIFLLLFLPLEHMGNLLCIPTLSLQ